MPLIATSPLTFKGSAVLALRSKLSVERLPRLTLPPMFRAPVKRLLVLGLRPPGARVAPPLAVTLQLIVPPSVGSLASTPVLLTVTATVPLPSAEPLLPLAATSTPPLMVVPPAYVFGPERICVPGPLITSETVALEPTLPRTVTAPITPGKL